MKIEYEMKGTEEEEERARLATTRRPYPSDQAEEVVREW